MTKSVEPFRTAMRVALNALKEQGVPVIVKEVIGSAKYADGRKVGTSTLYRKRKKTGEFIHRDLIDEIGVASKGGSPSPANSGTNKVKSTLCSGTRPLELEVAALLGQLVTQEAKLIKALAVGNQAPQALAAVEIDNYVLASLVAHLAPGFESALDAVRTFESKYRDEPKLGFAKEEAQRQLRVLSMSNLVPFAGKPSKP